ncbi:MAG: porin family protein [candidate division Zixibacteria bacterium]
MLKKLICLFIFGALIFSSTSRAEFSSDNISLGFVGGFNIANVAGHAEETKSKTGLCFGGYINYAQNRYLSYQLELILNGKGYKITDEPYYDTANDFRGYRDLTYTFTYIEIPVLTKLTFLGGEKASLFLAGGGFFGMILNSKIRVENAELALDLDMENAKGADLGYVIGGGLNLRAGESGWVFVETRYEASFVGPIQGEDQKSRIISVRFGYWF